MAPQPASKAVKVRKSNIELLRIIAMIMVLGVHSNFLSLDAPSTDAFAQAPGGTFLRYFWQYVCIIGVNVFVMISGYFGIRLTYKRLLSYCFYLFYWAIIVVGVIWILNNHYGFLSHPVSLKDWLSGLTLHSMWFVIAYLMLMILSLPLNSFIQNADNKALTTFLLLFFVFETLACLSKKFNIFSNGYSALSFIGIYILGGYIRKNLNNFKGSAIRYILAYLAIIVVMAASIVATRYILHIAPAYTRIWGNLMTNYCGPMNILSAALLLIAFAKMDFHVPLINYVAASAFGVYLLHMNIVLFDTYLDWCRHLYNTYSPIPYSVSLILTFVAIFVFVTIVDQGRKYLSKILFR